MQNVGAPTSPDTNLNTASGEVEPRDKSEQPPLRKELSDNFCKSLEDDEHEQLDKVEDITNKSTPVVPVEELSPKSKTRSRFTSAFRSFRASKSAKKKLQPTPGSSSDQVLSSGGEDLEAPQQSDLNTESKKKKSKLSKKFSLGSIKKNKINPKKDEELLASSSNLLLVTSSTQTTQTLDRKPIFTQDNESQRKVTVTTSLDPVPSPYSLSPESSPTKFDKVRKIQITIQGKKIEHTNKINNNGIQGCKNPPNSATEINSSSTAAPTSTNSNEGEYLIANTDDPKQQQKQSTTTSTLKKNSKKNKKSKSKPNSPTTSPTTSPFSNKSITSTPSLSPNSSAEEKIVVVTQSIRDTPPQERAPAKPSRAPFTAVPPFIASPPTGAIRKTLSYQLPRLRRQKLQAVDSVDSSSASASNFMIREGSIDRGRRFPRPASIELNNDQISPPIIAQSQAPGLPTPLGIPESPESESNPKNPPPQTSSVTEDNQPSDGIKSPSSLEESIPHETINQKQRKIIIALPSFQSSLGSGFDDQSPLPEFSSAENSPFHYYVGSNNNDTSKNVSISELERDDTADNSIQVEVEQEVEGEENGDGDGDGDGDQSKDEPQPHENFNQKKQKVISLPSFASTSSLERDSVGGGDIDATSYQIDDDDDISLYYTQNPQNLGGLRQNQSIEDTNSDGKSSLDRGRGRGLVRGSESLEEETPIICDHRHNTRLNTDPTKRAQRTIPLSQLVLDSKDFSSLESAKSFESPPSPLSSQQRRKIQYINQATIYSEEEPKNSAEGEAVGPSTSGGRSRDGSVSSKKDVSFASVPGFSEYSFESELAPPDPSMPAFGDLTMDQVNPQIMTSSQEKREHLYKILVIGELGTGKTSFIKRYVHQFFSQNYRATIGVDFALKVLNWDSNTVVRLQLWDIAGQERFGNMTRVYYKEAVGAFIVFDVTRSGTFDCVSKWKEDLDSKVQLPDGSPIPCILLANKCDQDKQGIITSPEKLDEYVRENGFAGWFETSAKENINIDEAARALVNKILLNDKLISDADIADSEKFNLATSNGGPTTTQAIKSKCSC